MTARTAYLDARLSPPTATGCREWRQVRNAAGYGRAWDPEAGALTYAHRLAWVAHHGPIPDGLQVLHRCDNPPCCNPEHLWLGTVADNMRDKIEKGRAPVTRTPVALTADAVREIRRSYAAGHESQREIARRFGVSQVTVCKVIRRETWAHIE